MPRLFDLVSVKEPSILPAFYFALRDTLVAKDLEQATRIGLQGRTRHRVVTLQGELIDVSGEEVAPPGRLHCVTGLSMYGLIERVLSKALPPVATWSQFTHLRLTVAQCIVISCDCLTHWHDRSVSHLRIFRISFFRRELEIISTAL